MADARRKKIAYLQVQGVREKQPNKTRKALRIYRSLYLLYGSLLVGLALAVGHHFFNLSLDKRSVTSVSVTQSWALRIGTLLAFLVKLCLGASMSIAYIQLQWLVMRRNNVELKDVDALSNVLNSVCSFFDSSMWYRVPQLTVVAVLWWLLTLIPVITPGTLTAYSSRLDTPSDMNVSKLDFNSSYKYLVAGDTTWQGNGASMAESYASSYSLTQLVYATAFGGQVLPVFSSPAPNSSYRFDFTGPALRCTPANEPIVADMTKEFGISYPITNISTEDWNTTFVAQAASSYIPTCGPGRSSLSSNVCIDSSSSNSMPIDWIDRDAASIIIMSNFPGDTGHDLLVGTSLVRVNVTVCSLWNASYTTQFSFQYPNQSMEVEDVQYLNTVSAITFDADYQHYDRRVADSYTGMMLNMGALLCGVDQASNAGYNETGSFRSFLDIDWSGLNTIQLGLEQLFENLTMSLFSRAEFLSDESSTVPVVVTTYPTVYHYESNNLFAVYGVALLVALGTSLAGVYAIRINQGSYQNICSTFIRAGKECTYRLEDDDNGLDPYPKHLAKMPFLVKSRPRAASLPAPLTDQRLVPRKPVPSSSSSFLATQPRSNRSVDESTMTSK